MLGLITIKHSGLGLGALINSGFMGSSDILWDRHVGGNIWKHVSIRV